MTKRHYFQSLVILFATAYFLHKTFGLHWLETILLMLLMIVAVIHTMDIRDDWENRRLKRNEKRNGNGGRNGSVQGPQDGPTG